MHYHYNYQLRQNSPSRELSLNIRSLPILSRLFDQGKEILVDERMPASLTIWRNHQGTEQMVRILIKIPSRYWQKEVEYIIKSLKSLWFQGFLLS